MAFIVTVKFLVVEIISDITRSGMLFCGNVQIILSGTVDIHFIDMLSRQWQNPDSASIMIGRQRCEGCFVRAEIRIGCINIQIISRNRADPIACGQSNLVNSRKVNSGIRSNGSASVAPVPDARIKAKDISILIVIFIEVNLTCRGISGSGIFSYGEFTHGNVYQIPTRLKGCSFGGGLVFNLLFRGVCLEGKFFLFPGIAGHQWNIDLLNGNARREDQLGFIQDIILSVYSRPILRFQFIGGVAFGIAGSFHENGHVAIHLLHRIFHDRHL